MTEVDLELQRAVYERLRADAALASLVGSGIYDLPPAEAPYPYVTIGEADTVRDDVMCLGSAIVSLTIHAWSTYKGGYKEIKAIVSTVEDALHLAPLTLSTHRLIALNHRQSRVFRDADGLTSHAVIECVAYTEKL